MIEPSTGEGVVVLIGICKPFGTFSFGARFFTR